MTCTVFRIAGPTQSGKTLIGAGALRAVVDRGGTIAIISDNIDTARELRKRHILPSALVASAARRPCLTGYQAVLLDPGDLWAPVTVEIMRREMDETPGPSMLLVTENTR